MSDATDRPDSTVLDQSLPEVPSSTTPSSKTGSQSDLFSTYSDELYSSKPSTGKVAKKKLRGSMFRSLGWYKLIFYALVGGWFVYSGSQEHQHIVSNVTTYYDLETVITKPSRNNVRELLIPRVQETLTADDAFNEFNTQLALILSEQVEAQAGQPLPEKNLLAIGVEGDQTLAAALVVDTAFVEISSTGVEEVVGTRLSLSVYEPRMAVAWLQKTIHQAADRAREILVEKTFNKVEQRILEIKGGYSDQLRLGQRANAQRINNLQYSVDLATRLGVLLPIDEPHPLEPEGVDREYMQGVNALEKQLKVLRQNYANNALLDESFLIDENLRLELEALEKVTLDPRLVVAASTGNPYMVDKVVNTSESEFSPILALIKGLLIAWVILLIISIILSGLTKLRRKLFG